MTSNIELDIRFHIMRNCDMNYKGVTMNNDHLNEDVIKNQILPEINNIYNPANINWNLESVVDEDVNSGVRYYAGDNLEDSEIEKIKKMFLDCQLNTDRENNQYITTIIYFMMDVNNQSKEDEINYKLFHIYIYPFYEVWDIMNIKGLYSTGYSNFNLVFCVV